MKAPRKKRGAFRSTLEGSGEAKKLAALILEGLAGVRTPEQAAAAAGVSVQRYYVVETRALQGLIKALEPRRKGRQRGAEEHLAEALKDKERLERDLRRTQALLRSAQRVIGVQAAPPVDKTGKIVGAGKRKRRPVARAVKAVAILRSSEETKPQEPPAPTS